MAEDQEWLFDAVLGFLRSPAWALPVMSFIDDNCVVFDSGAPATFPNFCDPRAPCCSPHP